MNHRTVLWTIVLFGSAAAAHGQSPGNIFQATLGESGQPTAEVSTEQLRGILADKSAVVLCDLVPEARGRIWWVIDHTRRACCDCTGLDAAGICRVDPAVVSRHSGDLPVGPNSDGSGAHRQLPG